MSRAEEINSIIESNKTAKYKFELERDAKEKEFEEWGKQIKSLDEQTKVLLGLPEDVSLKVLFPSLYEEYPSKVKYLEDLENYNSLVDRINNYIDKRVQEIRSRGIN